MTTPNYNPNADDQSSKDSQDAQPVEVSPSEKDAPPVYAGEGDTPVSERPEYQDPAVLRGGPEPEEVPVQTDNSERPVDGDQNVDQNPNVEDDTNTEE